METRPQELSCGESNTCPMRIARTTGTRCETECVHRVHRSPFPKRLFCFVIVVLQLFHAATAQVATPSPTAPPPPPTRDPTKEPTPEPTFSPTSSPTDEPTSKPTRRPTRFPTNSPTDNPTRVPTDSPTRAPTAVPTRSPTEFPTRAPTEFPTFSPTSFPTDRPSESPTVSAKPSFMPSPSPSASPSASPSVQPTSVPSSSPSSAPSGMPSSAPSYPLQEITVSNVYMEVDDMQKMSGNSKDRFERETGAHIKKELMTQLADSLVTGSLELSVQVSDQLAIVNGTAVAERLLQENSRRLLKSPLQIIFDVFVELKSPRKDLDMDALVGGAFNSIVDKSTFLSNLQGTGDRTFVTINSLVVIVNGKIQTDPDANKNGNGGVSIGILAAAICGGLGLVTMAGYLMFKRRRKPQNKSPLPPQPEEVTRISTFIAVDREDDISTLGDPMFTGQGGMFASALEKDETVSGSIVEADYDYAMAYGGAGEVPSISSAGNMIGKSPMLARGDSSARSGQISSSGGDTTSNLSILNMDDQSLFADDSSFEKQYENLEERIEVLAPAGKLGVVIDTPNGGLPMVHAIKDSSVLADQVRVGDRLVSVDGEDTTTLTAIKVSRLISMKSENEVRNLVFVRTRSGDGEP